MRKILTVFLGLLSLLWISKTAQAGFPDAQGSFSAVNRFDNNLAWAKSQDLNLYAPRHFEKASETRSRLKQMVSERREPAELSAALREGEQELSQARVFARQAQQILAPAIQARQRLLEAGAREFDSKVWEVDRDLAVLAGYVEDGQIAAALAQRNRVAQEYDDLQTSGLRAFKVFTW